MIDYKEKTLNNGLTVLAHRDRSTNMAAVNILYKVGARNEIPSRTGFAHLFEHLMFRGTKNIPDFDIPVQQACGENNAFTNSDYTDYYITLPVNNIETALWLESDRMTGLNITPEALETEKMVVIEEYKQRYINQPYGDMGILLRGLVYKVHPYRWATIGLTPDHIMDATLEEVKDFYRKWYTPSNAILAISANIEEEKSIAMAEKWFEEITAKKQSPTHKIPQEPEQNEPRRLEITRKVPAYSITIGFKMNGRLDRKFYRYDIISDILSGGSSARLYQRLIKELKLFSALNSYITGDMDPGLFIITGQLLPGVSLQEGEKAIWDELERLKNEKVSQYELEKIKNKFESGIIFGELNIMNKAMNLCFYNMLGDMSLLNGEIGIFRSVTSEDIMAIARETFRPERSSTLLYVPKIS